MLLDRGFQVHNTGYPEAQRVLDHEALQLRPFSAGALVRVGDRLHKVGDPRRLPTWAPGTALAPIGSLKDKLLIARLAAEAALLSPDTLLSRPETTTYAALRARGLSDTVVDRFFRPFLSGVFLEDGLDTSSRLFDLLWRSFARGTQCVPTDGVQAIPRQLAAGTDVRLESPVEAVSARQGHRRAGGNRSSPRWSSPTAVPVAAGCCPGWTGPDIAPGDHLLPPGAPSRRALARFVLDGERSGPVTNTVCSPTPPRRTPRGGTCQLQHADRRAGAGGAPAPVRALRRRDGGLAAGGRLRRPEDALPCQDPPMGRFRKPVRLEPGCTSAATTALGLHPGALVSGRRAATAVLAELRPAAARP
jgi:hypothetical protein